MGANPKTFPYPLLEDARALASYRGWSEDVYRDLLAVRAGELSEQAFCEKYHWEKSIMVLDMTGLTRFTMEHGELAALLRIVEAHQVCLPVIRDGGAILIRSFADDLVALFDSAHQAVCTAFEVHQRMQDFAEHHGGPVTRCCIGIGHGRVLRIGPNLAQGDEMNRASKLGEDVARAGETLVTKNVCEALQGSQEHQFEPVTTDAVPFPYFLARSAR